MKLDAYSKDKDLYTAYGETLEPLPFHAMRSYPYGREQQYPDNETTRDYGRRFNTRRVEYPNQIGGSQCVPSARLSGRPSECPRPRLSPGCRREGAGICRGAHGGVCVTP